MQDNAFRQERGVLFKGNIFISDINMISLDRFIEVYKLVVE